MSSIPRPTIPLHIPSFPARKLRDIPSVPPKIDSYPALPSPARPLHFVPGYHVTTHIIPASYPRQSFREPRRYSGLDSMLSTPPPIQAKDRRRAWAIETYSKMKKKADAIRKLRAQIHHSEALTQSEDSPVLWIAVNRYARIEAPKGKKGRGITLVVAHGHSVHKEIWESTLKHIISLCDGLTTNIHVDEIWAMDFASYGDSALLNENKLDDFFDWIDNARDILNLVENFIPEGPFVASPHPLPLHLHRVSSECASQRQKFGFHDRNVLGVGHSMGGGIIANAACASPNLFQSLILIDPAIIPNGNSHLETYFIRALLRRQSWPSRDEARAQFLQNPFFKGWDPEVLDVYIQHGLADVPASEGGGVRLKMSSFQEAVNTIDNHFIQETYQILAGLDEKVKLRWIMPTVPLHLDPPEYRQAMVWRRPVNSSNVVIDLDHMMIELAPLVLAKEIVSSWEILHGQTIGSRL